MNASENEYKKPSYHMVKDAFAKANRNKGYEILANIISMLEENPKNDNEVDILDKRVPSLQADKQAER